MKNRINKLDIDQNRLIKKIEKARARAAEIQHIKELNEQKQVKQDQWNEENENALKNKRFTIQWNKKCRDEMMGQKTSYN